MNKSADTGASTSSPTANRKKRSLFGWLRNIVAGIATFYRQVIGELRKTVRPTRTELWTFFTVVLIFVLVIMAYVGVLDFLFGQLVLFIYGR